MVHLDSFIMKNGYIPSNSRGDDVMIERSYGPRALPQPEQHDAWKALCQDTRWNYQQDKRKSVYFAKEWVVNNDGHETIVSSRAHPSMNMCRGALAPQWVFNVVSPLEEPDDSMGEAYLRRLICAVTGRFVCISRPFAHYESLHMSKGIPQVAGRYWWRYWDNEGNVYQVPMEKWRGNYYQHLTGDQEVMDLVELVEGCDDYDGHSALPGDFTSPDTSVWMRMERYFVDPWCCEMRRDPMVTQQGEFWEFMFEWKVFGTTHVALWDQSLIILAATAGVPDTAMCRDCWLSEEVLDSLAASKGWNKQNDEAYRQPALIRYRKKGYRLDCYLSNGMVLVYKNPRPKVGEYDYSRQYFQDAQDVSCLFDNPEQDCLWLQSAKEAMTSDSDE